MKKALFIISILSLLFTPVYALTDNTHSTDLEASSSQSWSITDASQTGLEGNSITIALWVKFESPVSGGRFVSKGDGATTDQYEFSFATAGPNLNFGVNTSNYDDETWDPSAGVWYHIAVTKDGSTGQFYVDGSALGGTFATDATITNTAHPFHIGSNADQGDFFDGKIDDVRFWTRALTAQEISDLYDDSCTFDDGASLGGEWLFDNDGTDDSGNSNDLTNNNTATFSTDTAYECAGGASEEVSNSQVI